MFRKFTTGGLVLATISVLSLFFGIWVIRFGFSGAYHPDFGEWLFLYYTVQVTVLVIALVLNAFHELFSEPDMYLIINCVFVNLLIYFLASLGFGTFDAYFPRMLEMLLDLISDVLLVAIIFWYRRLMG